MSGLESPTGMLTTDEVIDLERSRGWDFGPHHQHWLRQRAPEKVRRLLELAATRPGIVAAGQPRFVQSTPASINSSAAVNTTVTETNLWVPSLLSSIPPLDMEPGKRYKVVYGGTFTTTATPTYIFKPYVGGATTPGSNIGLGTGPTITAGTVPAGSPFFGELTMIVRATDVAYTAITCTGFGFNIVPAAAAAIHQASAMGASVPTTVPNTAASGLVVSITWGTSSASNSIQVLGVDFYYD